MLGGIRIALFVILMCIILPHDPFLAGWGFGKLELQVLLPLHIQIVSLLLPYDKVSCDRISCDG